MTGKTYKPHWENPKFNRCWVWILGFFCFLYLMNLGVRELQAFEALFFCLADEGLETGKWFSATVQGGKHVNVFPLYYWLVAVFHALGFASEWAVRLPSVLSVFGLAVICGSIVKTTKGAMGAFAAICAVLSAPVCLRFGSEASSDMLFAMLLNAAWMLWFRYASKRNWWAAWVYSLTCVALASLVQGALAFLYFYLPILFVHKPKNGLMRMRMFSHYATLALFILLLAVWLGIAEKQMFLPWGTETFDLRSDSSYLADILAFPVKVAAYFMPWTIFAWPAFCSRFRPMESDVKRNPDLFPFCRSIVISLFLVMWLLPNVAPHALIPLVGPLAILTGLHYENVIRRYYPAFFKFLKALAWTILVLAGAASLILFAASTGAVDFVGVAESHLYISLTLTASSFFIGQHFLIPQKENRFYWAEFTLAVIGFRFLFLAAAPFSIFFNESHRANALQLTESVPENETIYKLYLDNVHLIQETACIPQKIKAVSAPDALPPEKPAIYVLSGVAPPAVKDRSWTALGEPVYTDADITVKTEWKPEVRTLIRFRPVNRVSMNPEENVCVRMYVGRLRPPLTDTSDTSEENGDANE